MPSELPSGPLQSIPAVGEKEPNRRFIRLKAGILRNAYQLHLSKDLILANGSVVLQVWP